MKAKVFSFLIVSLLITCIVPAFNLAERVREGNYKKLGWKKISTLYTVDEVLPYFGIKAYSHGLSINSGSAFIGKDNWLFLGDNFGDPSFLAESITAKREGLSPERVVKMSKVIIWMNTWGEWFRKNGARDFRFMIGPDKEVIYPEYLPDWADLAPAQFSDILPAILPKDLFIDLYKPLKETKAKYAKAEKPLSIYYRTDTHWNSIGAWTAFSELAKSLGTTQPDIKWPIREGLGDVAKTEPRLGGDLSRFLHIETQIRDTEVTLNFDSEFKPDTRYYNYLTGEESIDNSIYVKLSLRFPLLTKTSNSLNQKKVLWLHDSFGIWMYPFMEATFSEILHVHPKNSNPQAIMEMAKSFKPDYVIVTNVERLLLAKEFFGIPPQ
ncbi:hypothetical protein WJT86_10690 [Microvirga sp. W0021]|uniref:AlgX/AlgJ SGNH hydrolase-like domain-containing protein n=1 Tax=Hohaiivirga grylli TaxID=3133970 RepID=A0ABV0BLQ1_9HYPH